MSPQNLLFKAQDGVPSSGMRHKVCFQPSGGCLHNGKHIAFTLSDLREYDIVNLSGLPILICQPPPPCHKGFNCLACLIGVHVSQLWITYAIMSMAKSTLRSRAHLYVASLP